MTDNIIKLGGATNIDNGRVSEACIASLEKMLAATKTGEIHTVAIVGLCHNGDCIQSISNDKPIGFHMVGAVEYMKTTILASMLMHNNILK